MAEEGQVISCHTVEAWTEQLEKGNNNNKLIVVDFTASWCGPCHFIVPFLSELAKKLPNVTFLKVDVDELKSVAQDWAIYRGNVNLYVPQRREDCLDKVVGAKKVELQQTIAKHISTATA